MNRTQRWRHFGLRRVSLAAAGAALAVAMIGVLAWTPGTAQAQAATSVATGTTAAGEVLVGPTGMTLYLFTRDAPGVSNCTGNCLKAWPPLLADAGATPSAGTGITGTLALIDRPEGRQITYNGWPLYYYAKDAAVGDAKGENVGGVWYTLPRDVAKQVTYLTAQDQPLPTVRQVTVRTAASKVPFYVVVHEGNASRFANVIGSSPLMQPGLYANVVVPVSRALTDGEHVWAMLHTENNGNTAYDGAAVDLPLNAGTTGNADFGGIAVGRALIGKAAVAPVPANAGSAGLAMTPGVNIVGLVIAIAIAISTVAAARIATRKHS